MVSVAVVRSVFLVTALLVAPVSLLCPAVAHATVISFEAFDLDDSLGPGGDYWQYTYAISGYSFQQDEGFSVFFDPTHYASLESPPPAIGSDWDIISLQPDPGLPDDGIFDAFALVNSPTPLSGFTINFVWLGAGGPGSQPFVVYDASFATVESGQTVPVPEPGTLAFLSMGVAGLSAHARRNSLRR